MQDALIWALTDDEVVAEKITLGFMAFQLFLTFFLHITLLLLSNNLLFYTLKETLTAEKLIQKIKAIAANK